MTKRQEPAPVVLGMHANDTLNVFVRNEDGALHQAARIMTHNGVEPSAMTAVMADLADTFGWRDIVAAPPIEVPHTQSRELLRDTGVAAAAPVTALPPATAVEVKPDFRRRPRRKAADMQLQRDTIVRLLSDVPMDGAWPTSAVSAQVAKVLRVKLSMSESTVRGQLQKLYDERLVGRISMMQPNGYEGYRWYGV